MSKPEGWTSFHGDVFKYLLVDHLQPRIKTKSSKTILARIALIKAPAK